MYSGKRVAVLIAAAGVGNRMGSSLPKQFLKIDGKTLLEKSAEAFYNNAFIDDIYIITSKEYIEEIEKQSFPKTRKVIEGGDTRQQSVLNGLEVIDKNTSIVLIHDAARPHVSERLIASLIEMAVDTGAAIPAIPIKDTIKIVDEKMLILNTPDRNTLYAAQTPQGFDYELIIKAHEQAKADGFIGTDDASLVERLGQPVHIVDGEEKNRKITTPEDMPDSNRRVGLGFDVHAFAEGRDLILGALKIPYDRGLLGHSDADVLTHALMDAILGALDLGDIGTNFPDTDQKYKDIKSILLLEKVRELMLEKGYTLENADLIIVAEKPKMKEHIPEMKKNLAQVMQCDIANISIKATTTEGLGFTGREEGIGAQAIVQLIRKGSTYENVKNAHQHT